jgi:hypothetical protein
MDWKIILLTALAAFMGGVGQLEFKRGRMSSVLISKPCSQITI